LQTAVAQSPLEVRAIKLDNGLTVWLNEDHTQASVFGAVVVKAGAKDSPATGIAHYFEHIMFKGTDKIGTTDYDAEKVYLDSIAGKYDLLAKTTDEAQRKEIQQEINRLSIEAAKFAIPNEFDNLTSKMGGSGLNAGTSYDFTVYYNAFIPQYIDQWLELNSERLLNPVFRLFQSELETVYEEKNMYNDQAFNVAVEKMLERMFKPHPYQYPVIGLTEYLKNPSLSEMEKFYQEYYRAGNMGLLLCGDFNSEDVIPVIKEKFGRIQAGDAPKRPVYDLPKVKGKEADNILLPYPIVKISASVWQGVPNGSKDDLALKTMLRLLSNSSETGYLDLLGTDGKLLGAGIENLNLNDAGVILTMIIPKLLFQSYKKADKLVMNEINRVKKGDFTDDELECIKLEMKREFETDLETLNKKGQMMLQVFTEGKEWSDYLKELENIEKLTKTDIVNIANKYLTDDYLYFTKKKGSYNLEKVDKPGFDPIVPPNKNETSEYAKKLIAEAENKSVIRPRTINFDKDVVTVAVTPLVTLYTKENETNDIFTLQLNYRKGKRANNMVDAMSMYLNDLPTDSLSCKELRSALQKLGGKVDFWSSDDAFTVNITGFENNIEPTLQLVSHFMHKLKPDKKSLKRIVDAEKMSDKMSKKEPQAIADALRKYVINGQQSEYLTNPSAKEIKKKGKDGLLNVYRDVISTECDMHYAGKQPADKMKNLIGKYFNPEKVTQKADKYIDLPLQKYEKPTVFVLDNPKAKQSVIYGYTYTPTELDNDLMNASRLFNMYFGAGMTSIMFQEIREFRSFAYGAYSQYVRPGVVNKNTGSYLLCNLSTQSDKTNDALFVLDSLLKDMPVRLEKLKNDKQQLRNDIGNSYPSFRNVSSRIANMKRSGYNEDTNDILLDGLNKMDMDTVIDFYNKNIKSKTTCYIVAGNMKQVDMEKLKQFGEVKVVKTKEIFK
jgi:predicted Zn-dependent peptidase